MNTYTSPAEPIIVVGAGLAGLTAAHSLSRAGLTVVVLEAHDRAGGRLRTEADGFESGQYGELGAELLCPASTATVTLCRELGIELSKQVWIGRPERLERITCLEGLLSPGQVIVDGTLLSANRVESVAGQLRGALRDSPPAAHETIAQWLRRARLSGDAHHVLGGLSRALTQQEPARTDAHVLTRQHVGVGQRIVGGASRLAETLQSGLDVRVNAPVASVRQRRGRITVSLDNGDTFTSGQAVVAVPPLVLGSIGFDPPLPAATAVAATAGPRAHGGKVVAQYREGDVIRAVLTHGVFTDGAINSAWVSNTCDTSGPAVVSGLVCGSARALLARGETALDALDALVRTATGNAVTRTHGLVKNWTADPYFLAAGGVPPASLRGEQTAILAAPERRVHFAGAHTDDLFCDTLEGAVRSGVRAAAEVLRHPVRINADDCNAKLVKA